MLLDLSEPLFVLLQNILLVCVLCLRQGVLPLQNGELFGFILELGLALFQDILQVGLALN